MPESGDGQFSAQFATTRPGVYRFRIRAQGTTLSGESFTREKTLTAAVWRGGDRVSEPGGGINGQIIIDYLREREARLCELLNCLVQRDGDPRRGIGKAPARARHRPRSGAEVPGRVLPWEPRQLGRRWHVNLTLMLPSSAPARPAPPRRGVLAQRGCSVALLERSRFDELRVGESLAPASQPLLIDLGVWSQFLALQPLPSYGTRSLWGEATPRLHSHLMSSVGLRLAC